MLKKSHVIVSSFLRFSISEDNSFNSQRKDSIQSLEFKVRFPGTTRVAIDIFGIINKNKYLSLKIILLFFIIFSMMIELFGLMCNRSQCHGYE